MQETISLVRLPGVGQRDVDVDTSWTVRQLVEQESLFGRNILLNGQAVTPDQYNTTTLEGVVEVFAVGAVKGN